MSSTMITSSSWYELGLGLWGLGLAKNTRRKAGEEHAGTQCPLRGERAARTRNAEGCTLWKAKDPVRRKNKNRDRLHFLV